MHEIKHEGYRLIIQRQDVSVDRQIPRGKFIGERVDGRRRASPNISSNARPAAAGSTCAILVRSSVTTGRCRIRRATSRNEPP
jgi:hypothetical protein